DSFNPRVALVWMPGQKTTFKYLAGRAFRAPSAYEQYYTSPGYIQRNPALEPETIMTHEIVWEQDLGREVALTLSGYHYRLADLIPQGRDTNTGLLVNLNTNVVRTYGCESEIRFRVRGGVTGAAWVSYHDTEIVDGANFIAGSPDLTGNLGLVVPFERAF